MKTCLNTFAALIIDALLVAPAAAQPRSGGQPLAAGTLLVATPAMQDPNFARTVVLVLTSSAQSTIGLIINQPTWVSPNRIRPGITMPDGYDGTVYLGGPLASDQLVYLVRDPPTGAIQGPPLFDNVYLGNDTSKLAALRHGDAEHLRLYAGHAAWAANQLQREIAAHQWTVLSGTAAQVFSPNPEALWQLLTQEGSRVVVDVNRPTSIHPLRGWTIGPWAAGSLVARPADIAFIRP